MSIITEEITFFEFANRFLDLDDMNTPVTIDISELDIKVETQFSDGSIGFSPMTTFVVKPTVSKHYLLEGLRGSADHRILVGDEYVRLADHPDAKVIDESLCIVDTTVPETENYIANGQVNHNSSPGGKALKHACSLMLNMAPMTSASEAISNSSGQKIGHTVKAKIQKNKVGAPYKTAEYKIEYLKGIVQEDIEIFDLAIKYNLITRPSTKTYCIEGSNIVGRGASIQYLADRPELMAKHLAEIREFYINNSEPPLGEADDEEEEEVNPLISELSLGGV